ncbi:hypothetical protein Plhal304r1_c002g0007761 [Plasmopara halstedii]
MLQHNALFIVYRLQHLSGAQSMCHHECEVLETTPCRITELQALEWNSAFFHKSEPKPAAKARYGCNIFMVFHIVRVVIFGANVMDVQARFKAVVVLHIERYYQELLYESLSHLKLKRRS